LATLPEADIVLAAISGRAGLASTLAAAQAGKKVAIANKEPLVAAGELLTAAAARSGATLFPVDSEHSALFQLLQGRDKKEVARIILTGSGGPFREAPADLASVTPEQALAHPTWKMGAKVTIDSATLMNKGLEIIEAHWLFVRPFAEIDVVIHPQSIIHAMVEFNDGAWLAHLSAPDMRLPIQYALGFPERLTAAWSQLDLIKAGRLDFLSPDDNRFPCLRLARQAGEVGGTAPAVMNAANEIAVAQFLTGKIKFTDIPRWVEKALASHQPIPHPDLETILQAEGEVRGKLQVN
jgi:1-deoxy-D-xylulose-5-phosphate reductoisomerase